MIRVTIQMKVKPGKGSDFERAWEAIADKVRQVPGNLRQALMKDQKDPESFVLTSDWQSPEQFHAFERSPEQDDLTAPLRELRQTASMTIHQLIKHVQGA
jgi:heme-degrading monooxygenase HmoA